MIPLSPTVFAVLEGLTRAVEGHHRRAGSWSGLTYILSAVVLVAAVWVGLVLWERFRARNATAGSGTLFDELAGAHALSVNERQLVRRAAELAGYGEPALAFVRPESIDALAVHGECDSTMTTTLHRRLFGSPE